MINYNLFVPNFPETEQKYREDSHELRIKVAEMRAREIGFCERNEGIDLALMREEDRRDLYNYCLDGLQSETDFSTQYATIDSAWDLLASSIEGIVKESEFGATLLSPESNILGRFDATAYNCIGWQFHGRRDREPGNGIKEEGILINWVNHVNDTALGKDRRSRLPLVLDYPIFPILMAHERGHLESSSDLYRRIASVINIDDKVLDRSELDRREDEAKELLRSTIGSHGFSILEEQNLVEEEMETNTSYKLFDEILARMYEGEAGHPFVRDRIDGFARSFIFSGGYDNLRRDDNSIVYEDMSSVKCFKDAYKYLEVLNYLSPPLSNVLHEVRQMFLINYMEGKSLNFKDALTELQDVVKMRMKDSGFESSEDVVDELAKRQELILELRNLSYKTTLQSRIITYRVKNDIKKSFDTTN